MCRLETVPRTVLTIRAKEIGKLQNHFQRSPPGYGLRVLEAIPNKKQFAKYLTFTRIIAELARTKAMQSIELCRRNQIGVDRLHEKRAIDAGIHLFRNHRPQLPSVANPGSRITVDNRKLPQNA